MPFAVALPFSVTLPLVVAALTSDRGERVLAVGLLVALGGGLFWLGDRPVRPPRLLGPFRHGRADGDTLRETAPVRGVGRFARPRP